MIALVACAFEDAEEDKPGGHGSVKDTQEDQRWDHEGEGDFLVEYVTERSECRSGVVLCTCVDVHDGSNQAEDDDFGNGDGPQSFGKVLGVLHLRDETGNRNLADESVADVEEGVHTRDKRGPSGGDNQDDGITTELHACRGVNVVWIRVVTSGMGLNPSEDGRQQNRDEGEKGRCGCKLGKSREGPWQRAEKGNDRHDNGKSDRAHAMVGHSVQILGSDQDMEALDDSQTFSLSKLARASLPE